jgi:P4 family phage/plasmid primase-like protien
LRSLISTELVEDYRKLQKKIIEELDEDNNEEEAEKVRKNIRKIISNLKCAPFKSQVMKECEEVFYDEQFLNRLDKNVYLIGFENGVYDLKEGKFRAGKPEDYMSMTTKYDYREFNEDDPEIAEVNEFLLKIFPDKRLRDFFIKKSAEELQGGNFTKTFVVMTGIGDNGKSITIELKEHAFGQYAIKLPTSLITGKRTQSSGATPELERMIGVRFAVLQEPDNKDVINIGMLKELTGNDTMYVRGLYKEGKEVKPMFKLVLVCNKLPRLPCDDPATWNRIRVLEFESRFPKNASEVPKTFEDQLKKKVFPRDENMSEKLNEMKYPFMWMLTQEYKRLQRLKVREPDPDIVMKATLIYRENNDIFFQFVREKYVFDPTDKDAVLTIPLIYEVFKHWFRDSFPNLKVPTKNELKEDLLLRWKDALTKDGKFVGYREKSALEVEKKEDNDDNDEIDEKKNVNKQDEKESDSEDEIVQHNSHEELYDTDEVEESICINRDDTDDESGAEESINIRRDDSEDDDLEDFLNR